MYVQPHRHSAHTSQDSAVLHTTTSLTASALSFSTLSLTGGVWSLAVSMHEFDVEAVPASDTQGVRKRPAVLLRGKMRTKPDSIHIVCAFCTSDLRTGHISHGEVCIERVGLPFLAANP